ncbi:MAG: c-type cytochrome [Planctomycetaceae bacterium]
MLVPLARTDRRAKLFDAIESGAIAAADVPPVRRSLLLKSGDPATKARAEKLFGSEATPAARRELIARYRQALAGTPDPAAGRVIFTRECANCHRLGGEGHDVGPALVTVRARTSAEILEHILDPNREVSPHFLEYVILQHDGTIKTGAIAAETPTSFTLRQPLGKQETVLRSDIDTVTSSGKSLMPEGLEQKVTPDEMRNLIEYVRTATK